MEWKSVLIFLICMVGVVALCGCSSLTINDPVKQDQLVLQVDPQLLEPVQPLITIEHQKQLTEEAK